jgi:hypothetical protein
LTSTDVDLWAKTTSGLEAAVTEWAARAESAGMGSIGLGDVIVGTDSKHFVVET